MVKDFFKRLFKFYSFELLLGIITTIIAVYFVYAPYELISALARKVALASSGLVIWYIIRYIKIGTIEWNDNWQKIYALALLFYIAIIFAFG